MKRRSFISAAASFGGLFIHASTIPNSHANETLKSIEEEDRLWRFVRRQFLFPNDFVYLNTGGIGALPASVLHRVQKSMENQEINPSPGHNQEVWNSIKAKAAVLFGCTPQELALTNTATEGINIIINGLPLKKGDEIITSTHEHPALKIALLNRKIRDGIVIKTFEPDLDSGDGNLERIERLMGPKTRLIFISHITCTTGQRFPEEAICRLAHSRNIWFALDGAQVIGSCPIDVQQMGVDFYAISGHKWLLGPRRTGILYVRKEHLDLLQPITVGAYSDQEHELLKGTLSFHPDAQRYEYATQNEALYHGLDEAMDFIQAISIPRIWKHNRTLAEMFQKGLETIPSVELLSPSQEEYRSHMISFRLANTPLQKVMEALAKKRIRVRPVSEAGLDCVRVSFHVCNQTEDVETILEAIHSLAAQV